MNVLWAGGTWRDSEARARGARGCVPTLEQSWRICAGLRQLTLARNLGMDTQRGRYSIKAAGGTSWRSQPPTLTAQTAPVSSRQSCSLFQHLLWFPSSAGRQAGDPRPVCSGSSRKLTVEVGAEGASAADGRGRGCHQLCRQNLLM